MKNSKYWHYFKGVNPWFWSKNGHFSNFFLSNISQENVFYDDLERKNAFLGYKNKKFKRSKNGHFSKGLTHGFGPKMPFFFNLFFKGNIVQRKVFYDILERKNAFLGYKNKKFKRSKYYHYFKRVNPWSWSENGHFCKLVFFKQYKPGKCLLRCSRTKKCLSRL